MEGPKEILERKVKDVPSELIRAIQNAMDFHFDGFFAIISKEEMLHTARRIWQKKLENEWDLIHLATASICSNGNWSVELKELQAGCYFYVFRASWVGKKSLLTKHQRCLY